MAQVWDRLDLNVGYAEWEPEWVLVGDRAVPKKIEVHFLGGDENPQPALDFTIEIQDGVPVCTTLTFFQRQDGRGVRQDDLRKVRLLDWMEEIVTGASRKAWVGTGGDLVMDHPGGAGDVHGARKMAREMQRGGRRKIDERHLRRVAEVYGEHEDVDAVALAFGTSYRSAARWVQKARQEGLL